MVPGNKGLCLSWNKCHEVDRSRELYMRTMRGAWKKFMWESEEIAGADLARAL